MKYRNKNIYIVLIVLVLFGVSIGYSAINRTLNITGNSEVKENTWNIYFDNVKVKDGSVTSNLPVIDSTIKSTVSFNVMLNLPGDFYEFTIDVINNGTIDAMLDSIVKTPELTETQKKYLNYIVEYENGKQVNLNQMVKAGEFVRLKVKVEYRTDLTEFDLPQEEQNLSLGFELNYVQSDNTAVPVSDNGVFAIKANGDINEIGTIVTIGTEQFYVIGTDGENVKLLSRYNLYVGNECTSTLSSSCTPYGDEAHGMQEKTMLGRNELDNTSKGTVVFSSDEQHGVTYDTYNGSVVEGYVNSYQQKLESLYDVDIKEARLITVEELTDTNLKCSTYSYTCNKAPEWVFSSSYWTSSASSYVDRIWGVSNYNSNLNYYQYSTITIAGVRPVIEIAKSDISVEMSIFAAGNIEKIGTIVTIGSEEFYTIGTVDNNVKLLAMYNLYVGQECTSVEASSCTLYGEEADGMQHMKFKGLHFYDNVRRGVTAFASEEKHGIRNYDYEGSIVEGYVNDYKIKLEEKFDIKIEEARLLTHDDITTNEFGCTISSCRGAPSWVYSCSYWLGSPSEYSNCTISSTSNGSIGTGSYSNSTSFGVRPVIIVSKFLF